MHIAKDVSLFRLLHLMKKALLILFTLIYGVSNAQNYQCLQNGVTRFFTNNNGYLRAIQIRAVNTYPDSILYFPFHTPRGSNPYALDTNGGCWLGKKVKQLNDGTFLFDNNWSDSAVTIQTQAYVGDSWVFYHDTGSLYYEAEVTSADTMTILGIPDSVKRITIRAINASGFVTSDSLDNFQIILSKNNGFVRVFDLYTFPYHKPDSSFIAGRDVYLDMSASPSSPNRVNQQFNVVSFLNPNDQQLYDWNVGDVLESEVNVQKPEYNPQSDDYILNTVVDKTVSGHIATYTLSGTHYDCGMHYVFPCTLVSNSGTYYADDRHYSLADEGYIPETVNAPSFLYFPDDMSNCMHSPIYCMGVVTSSGRGSVVYKAGIGMIHYRLFDEMGQLTLVDLVYSNFKGSPCGKYIPTSVDNIPKQDDPVTLLPNPVQNELTIFANEQITSIVISNSIGQNIYSKCPNSNKAIVDVSTLPAGLYFIRINDLKVSKFVKQ